jgi:DNA topoisomerase-2
MTPFYDGFVGDIVPEDGKREGSYQVFGKIERLDDTNLFISELPIKKWTQDYQSIFGEHDEWRSHEED